MQPKIITITDEDFDLDSDNFEKLDQPFDENRVSLDPYNADLNVKISSQNRLIAESLSQDGFAFMLASVRATHGFNKGKIGFEVKILEVFDVSNAKLEETHTPEIRIGWSTCEANMRLGESNFGFGFCQNGKKVTSGQFLKYGQEFGLGDVVAALVDFDRMQISFTLNGQQIDPTPDGAPAFKLPDEWTCAAYGPPLFPHVTVKNVKFQVNFGDSDIRWFGLPGGYSFLNEIPPELRIKGVLPPATKAECNVLCMIGLPGSGKTTWVREFLRQHSNERWCVLSTSAVLEQMKVQGVARKKLHHGRWDLIMGAVVKCLNRLILLGCRMRKNYILDLTNCYTLPRRKKMTPFQGFGRKAIVLVPTIEDYANRCHQQMMLEGKQMPSDAILEMKACFSLPKEDENDIFDEIEYVELQPEDAQKVVDYFNEEGKAFKPREKKRRGDWQQEELPPEMMKKYKTSKPSTMNVLKPASFKSSTTNSNVKWVPTAAKINSTFSAHKQLNGVSSPASNSSSPAPSTFTHRNSTSTPGPFTPRAGWPANWPQALWGSNLPSTSSQAMHHPPVTTNSPIVFPPP